MLEDSNLTALAALPTPLPPSSTRQVFTAEQWATLLAITEVFVPAITSSGENDTTYAQALSEIRSLLPQDSDPQLAEKFLAETVANRDEFKESLRQRFDRHLGKPQVAGLGFLLNALGTRFGSLAMTGSTVLLHTRSLPERTRVVLGWAGSYIGPLRALFQATDFVTRATWIAQSATLHKVIGYPEIPKDIERHPGYDCKFIDFTNGAEDTIELEADVVIVGSGCGAGVVAEHLSRVFAQNGSGRVIVLEKGYHYPSSHYPMEQNAAGERLQESGGGVLADDGSIAAIAGSTWGGGGTINWSASLQPQHFVRDEWAKNTKLPFALTQEFQDDLDEVCDRMGVCKLTDSAGLAKIEHNYGNQTLLEAARRLGLTTEIVPQNTAGKRHYCGRCHFGCASATKQGPANFWLPAAAENGCEFIEGCLVNKITWDETVKGPRTANGIDAIWTSRDHSVSRKLNIRAKRIVVSSGTLHSPLVLHRSGLGPEHNRHIGSNLHLHPVLTTRGVYKERVDPWDGAILTTAMTSLENLDGKGHGPKIEVMLGTPELQIGVMPFRTDHSLQELAQSPGSNAAATQTALQYKLTAARHGHAFAFIAIQRDHADLQHSRRCYVYGDAQDPSKLRINYTPSAADREHLLQGALTAARMHFIKGAELIEINSALIPVFERPSSRAEGLIESDDIAAFEDWVDRIRTRGIACLDPRIARLGSAHQMGTCRMAGTPDLGAVDPQGKVWGTQNVFVADASILPSASGVNPMVSTMGLSLHVARSIAKEILADRQ